MITSSSFIQETPQVDGRFYVTEIHIDNQLGELRFTYLAEPTDNVEQIMNDRAASLNEGGQ